MDLIANLISIYAGVLDLDNLPNPEPLNEKHREERDITESWHSKNMD